MAESAKPSIDSSSLASPVCDQIKRTRRKRPSSPQSRHVPDGSRLERIEHGRRRRWHTASMIGLIFTSSAAGVGKSSRDIPFNWLAWSTVSKWFGALILRAWSAPRVLLLNHATAPRKALCQAFLNPSIPQGGLWHSFPAHLADLLRAACSNAGQRVSRV